jgi:hypothetical protein
MLSGSNHRICRAPAARARQGFCQGTNPLAVHRFLNVGQHPGNTSCHPVQNLTGKQDEAMRAV